MFLHLLSRYLIDHIHSVWVAYKTTLLEYFKPLSPSHVSYSNGRIPNQDTYEPVLNHGMTQAGPFALNHWDWLTCEI